MAAVIGNGFSTFEDMWGQGRGTSSVVGNGDSHFGDMTSTGTVLAVVSGTGSSTFGSMLGFGTAVVGPPMGFPDGYYYTVLPNIFPVPFPGDAVIPGPPVINNPRVLLEHAIFDRKIRAERVDLLDGRRVFRTLPFFLQRMQKDAIGYFIGIAKWKFYFTAANPVAPADGFFHDWNPL